MKCKTCKYNRFGVCRLGLTPNDKCMFYKPDKRKIPMEKILGEHSSTPSQTG